MDQKTRRSGHPAQIKMRKYPVAAETMVMLPVSPKPLCKPKCCTFSGAVHTQIRYILKCCTVLSAVHFQEPYMLMHYAVFRAMHF